MSRSSPSHKHHPLVTIGWREWVSFPDLGISKVKAKIDTGARSSCLHADSYEIFSRDGAHWVRFVTRPLRKRACPQVTCEAPLIDMRVVKSSCGQPEERPFIETRACLGPIDWPIQISLTNRRSMKFRMLLGRAAMAGKFAIEPQGSFLASQHLISTDS